MHAHLMAMQRHFPKTLSSPPGQDLALSMPQRLSTCLNAQFQAKTSRHYRTKTEKTTDQDILDLNISLWPSSNNLLGRLRRVLLEVLVEEGAELDDLGLEAILTRSPGIAWVEQFRRDVRAGLWHGKVEDVVVLVLDVLELAGVDGVEDGASVLQWTALATGSGTSTDPAGVKEPGVGLVVLDLLGQHLGVAHWVESEEGLGEAG
jgi:hypothetical protein